MAFAEILDLLGAPGWAVVAGSVAVVLYHLRSGLLIASRIGDIIKIGAILIGAILIADAGVVPGLELTVVPGKLWSWASGVATSAWDFLTGFA